jgi:hypothetical protein
MLCPSEEVSMVLANVWKKLVPISLLCVAVIGCGPAEPEFGFGEKDMQDAILGDWQGTMTLEGRAATTFTLTISQGFPGVEPACESRTFSEPACVETTSMNLTATLTTADALFDAAMLDGSFFVFGLELNNGELSLSGGGIQMTAGIDAAKPSHEANVSGDQSGKCMMQR